MQVREANLLCKTFCGFLDPEGIGFDLDDSGPGSKRKSRKWKNDNHDISINLDTPYNPLDSRHTRGASPKSMIIVT